MEYSSPNHEERIEIGSGAYGNVYLGIYADSLVAIKKCRKPEDSKIEIANLRKFLGVSNHAKNLVNVLNLDESSREMVLELCNRGNLEDYINNNELSTLEIKFLFKQAAEGLQVIHSKGLIHRDIKPKNILLHEDTVVKIADFGEAKDRIETETVKGTVGYISYQIANEQKYTNKTDIFSLGVVLYFMYYRKIPWGKNQHNLKEEINNVFKEPELTKIFENHPGIYIPESAKDLIKKMLQKSESDRYSCKEVLSHPFLMFQKDEIQTVKKTNSFLSMVGEVPNNPRLKPFIDKERKKDICRTISEKIYYEQEKIVFLNNTISELLSFVKDKPDLKRTTRPLILLLTRYCAYKSDYFYQYLQEKKTHLFFKSADWKIFYSISRPFYEKSLKLFESCRKTNSKNLTKLLDSLTTMPEPYDELLAKDFTPSIIFFKWLQKELLNFFKYVAKKKLMEEFDTNEKLICLLYNLHLILYMRSIKSDFSSGAVNWEKYYENQSYEKVIEIMKDRMNILLNKLE